MRTASLSNHLEISILGLLEEEPRHGYELHRRMMASFGSLFQPSWGSLYPALSKLERRAYIETMEQSANRKFSPSTGSLAGDLATIKSAFKAAADPKRQRKCYAITQRGREFLQDLLTTVDASDDRAFWVALSFSDRLELSKRVSLVTKRSFVLEDRLRDLKESESFSKSGMRSKALQGLYARMSEELSWLDRVNKELVESENDRLDIASDNFEV